MFYKNVKLDLYRLIVLDDEKHLLLIVSHIDQALFWSWLIMLGVFIVDSSLTLFVRLANGYNIFKAHQDHAYQHAAKIIKSHKTISFSVLIINLAWLSPWAYLSAIKTIDGSIALIISYIPLIFIALYFNSGKKLS